ncbi:MAG: 1-acyl-sn-glycerol-3-phosphate acyltransferase [Myxococcaceae bacterium]
MLNRIKYSDDQIARLRDLGAEGIVAYVHRSRNTLLHWVLKKTIARFELPELLFSAFKPSSKAAQLIRSVRSGTGALEFFLRKPNTAFSQKKSEKRDYIKTLIRLQRNLERPIFLVPHLLILGARSSSLKPSTVDMIFGSRGEPGFLRLLFRLLIFSRSAKWAITEPLNLKIFLENNPQATDEVLSRRVRGVVLKRLKILQRTYHGPSIKGAQRIQLDTLRDNDLQNFMAGIETQTGLPKVKLYKKAQQYYSEIAARFDVDMIHLMDKILSFVWNRIYDGIVWKASDIDKLKQASQRGPVILVPAHRSHMDYVVLSQILYWEGLMLPHVAAGNNLSFFPLGSIFRRGGAYFIRRSFKGDPLYPQVMRAYIKRLLREGYTQEFFIEGGRSRSGKTLPPKLGLLSIIVDCLTKHKLTEATFIPVSISYEKLLEAGEYRRELEGAEKKAESRRDLFSSLKFLKRRYGRVFVNFDEPISFVDFYQEDQKDLVKGLAHRIISGIHRCTVVTPVSLVATAMLASKRRILSRAQLEWSVKKIAQYVQIPKPNIECVLESLLQDSVLIAEQAGRRTYYRVPEKAALSLDYYKNSLIHHFVADSILATAFSVSCGNNRRKIVKKSILSKQAQILSQIFKFEFSYPAGTSFEELFESRVQSAIDSKIMTRVQDQIRLNESKDSSEQLFFAANLLSNFIDAYWVCSKRLEAALTKAPTKKVLVGVLLDFLKEAVLSGATDYPEIVSKSLAENAVLLFEDLGILVWESNKAKLKQSKKEELKNIIQVLQEFHYGR